MDGVGDAPSSCSSCHGTPGRTAQASLIVGGETGEHLSGAPPADSVGSGTSNEVGPHQGHVRPTAGAEVFSAVLCTECHANADLYTGSVGNGHRDGLITVAFKTGGFSRLNGVNPGWLTRPAAAGPPGAAPRTTAMARPLGRRQGQP